MNSRTVLPIGLAAIVSLLDACQARPETRTTPLDPSPRVVVMSDFEIELQKLRSPAESKDTYVINGRSYYVGRLAGHDVVLLPSGASMVNIAMTTGRRWVISWCGARCFGHRRRRESQSRHRAGRRPRSVG